MHRIRDKNKELQCSAEGNISHIYADRMGSRPLGWSRKEADQMSRLRIYEKKGGDMLELGRSQREALPMVAGCEKLKYSRTKMLSVERKNRNTLGALADMSVYRIPYPQIKKLANLKNHIWGL